MSHLETPQKGSQIMASSSNSPASLQEKQFKLVSDFEPRGSQPQAIEKLVSGLKERGAVPDPYSE